MSRDVITSVSIDSRKNNWKKLRNQSSFRSNTPIPKCITVSSRVDSPILKSDKNTSFYYDTKSRKVTVPLIGDILLGRQEFNLISPTSSIPVFHPNKKEFKKYKILLPPTAGLFLKESQEMFTKKRNYLSCLRKSIKELKVLKISGSQLANLNNILFNSPYEHPKSRQFLRACKNGTLAAVKTVIKECPYIVHSFDDMKMTGLHWCALRGNIEIATVLLANNAVVDAVDVAHRTALFIAVKSGDFEVIRFFLINKADPSITSDSRRKLIDYAKDHAIYEIIRKAVMFHNMMKHIPSSKWDEKWKIEVVPAFLRLSGIKKDGSNL